MSTTPMLVFGIQPENGRVVHFALDCFQRAQLSGIKIMTSVKNRKDAING